MSADHPCKGGLSPECIKAYPGWARKMFAYRLLITLCPHEITKRLPQLKGLFPLLVPPEWPVNELWVPGITIDPEVVFPPDWNPGDPLPDGVLLEPGTVFPPDWKPGDPLPAGVTISPGAVFPAGWTAGDSLPAGVSGGIGQRPSTQGTGALAPLYVGIWEPGPAHRTSDQEVEEAEVWFEDNFDTLNLSVWNDTSTGGNTASASGGNLVLAAPNSPAHARIQRSDARATPINADVSWRMALSSVDTYAAFNTYVGNYSLDVLFYESNRVDIWTDASDYTTYVLPLPVTSFQTYRFEQRGSVGAFYQNDVLVVGDIPLEGYGAYPVIMDIMQIAEGIAWVDYYKIVEVSV